MPPTTKPTTAAELSALEHAFAADPASDAYRPLTEAYLAMGRKTDAMKAWETSLAYDPDYSRSKDALKQNR